LFFVLLWTLAIVGAVGLVALIAPPNNWDSMTYHMSRVMHWTQNQNVAHYPTAYVRQLYQGPWSGFVITHLQILSGGDRFSNLIQWFSMIGSIVGVSLIAEQLGARLRGQILAAAVCATIPMGILQGSSTQTDYVGAFWIVCLAYATLLAIQNKMNIVHAPMIGATLWLSLLAKGTSYIYALPFLLWLLIVAVKRLGWKLWKPALISGSIALLINLGHYQRNYSAFGSVLGPSEEYTNEGTSVLFIVSNIIRNSSFHVSTPVRSINLVTIKVINGFHNLLGIDASDPRTTFPPGQKFDMHSLINHEDLAGNPLHFILFGFSVACFLLGRYRMQKQQQDFLFSYLLTILSSFILFCYLIVWSPWRSRLHLSLFVLASAFIGTVLSELIKPRLANFAISILLVSSLFWLSMNESRPLLFNSKYFEEGKVINIFNTTRSQQYFMNIPEFEKPFMDGANILLSHQCSEVGLSLGNEIWEYPFWILLKRGPARPHLRYINTNLPLKQNNNKREDLELCGIIAGGTEEETKNQITFDGDIYKKAWSEDPIAVFLKADSM
jgi:hypothetical protein